MLSMPRIVRPDPLPEFGSPADRALERSFSETKNYAAVRQSPARAHFGELAGA